MNDFRELFRYEKAGRVRIYNLRAVSHGAELWVASSKAGKVTASRKLMTFNNPDEATIVQEDVEQTLRAGGWREI